jgi:hypothetical protein
MDLLKVLIFAIGSVILGVLGGFAARSVIAGIILAVFVFLGWFLWRLFKLQDIPEENKEAEVEKES